MRGQTLPGKRWVHSKGDWEGRAAGRDRHLGTDAGILKQHPCPDGRVAGHEAPVPADLGGM